MKKQNEQQHKDLIKSNKNITGKAKVNASYKERPNNGFFQHFL